MILNFKDQQDNIIDYVNINYSKYLNEYNIKAPNITVEFIDFDKFKNDFICFIEFDSSTFPNTNSDDCTMNENSIINIYLAHRNNTPKILNEFMLNSSSAFFKMVRHNMIKGAVTQKINKIDYFKYIEGTTNIFCSKITLEVNYEV